MIIGITGSIATGKTLVTNYLREKGYKVIDADEISRAVLNKGEKGYDEVLKYFSENILDQEKNIDRKKLAQIIFTDEEKRRVLEKQVTGGILSCQKQFKQQAETHLANSPLNLPIIMTTFFLVKTGTIKISTSRREALSRLLR